MTHKRARGQAARRAWAFVAVAAAAARNERRFRRAQLASVQLCHCRESCARERLACHSSDAASQFVAVCVRARAYPASGVDFARLHSNKGQVCSLAARVLMIDL